MVRTPKQRKKEDQVEVHIHEPSKSPEDHINQLDTPAEEENLGSSTTTTSNPHPSPSHTTSEQAIYFVHIPPRRMWMFRQHPPPQHHQQTHQQKNKNKGILTFWMWWEMKINYQGKWKRWNRSGYIFTDAQELHNTISYQLFWSMIQLISRNQRAVSPEAQPRVIQPSDCEI